MYWAFCQSWLRSSAEKECPICLLHVRKVHSNRCTTPDFRQKSSLRVSWENKWVACRTRASVIRKTRLHLCRDSLFDASYCKTRGLQCRASFFSRRKEISSFRIKNLPPLRELKKVWLTKGIPLSRESEGWVIARTIFFLCFSFLRNFSRFFLDMVRISRNLTYTRDYCRLRIHMETTTCVCACVLHVRARDGESQSSQTTFTNVHIHLYDSATPFRIFSRFFLADPHPKQDNVEYSLRSW